VSKTPQGRRIILSSSSESEAEPLPRSRPQPVPSNDVIVISDSSDEEGLLHRERQIIPKELPVRSEPPLQEDEDPWGRDESILEL
jgi:hypothetical protein